jgi:hypothetical protein
MRGKTEQNLNQLLQVQNQLGEGVLPFLTLSMHRSLSLSLSLSLPLLLHGMGLQYNEATTANRLYMDGYHQARTLGDLKR